MYSKEESRKLRETFWISFGKSFPKKWLLYNTKIKGLSFKFYFDTKKAFVSMDLDNPIANGIENRINYWEKLESLKNILHNDFLPEAIFEKEYYLENGKEISRIYVPLDQKVSIHNKNSWQTVMEFFNEIMPQFEAFFWEYEDFIKS